jgi:hypothetical protein
MPTIADKPVELHPPPLKYSVKIVLSFLIGNKTQRGIISTIPSICRITSRPSIRGSFFASVILIKIASKAIAIARRVPCQLWGV